jgi:hypothetical protein
MHPADLRVLAVQHYAEDPSEDLRVVLCPMVIRMVTSKGHTVQDRPVQETTIFFMDDSEPVTLNLNSLDLMSIENVIGAYGFIEG